jgi:L-alanine-DL-glutamate epimerase-like enolase superfamily enzyme
VPHVFRRIESGFARRRKVDREETMARESDVRVTGAALWLLPVEMRVPLKFGAQVMTAVTCARAAVEVENRGGRRAVGWGETPLSIVWGWPSNLDVAARERAMIRLAAACCRGILAGGDTGHPLELGDAFRHQQLDRLARESDDPAVGEPIPELAALISSSPVDLALHDAFGVVHGVDTFTTYDRGHLTRDLSSFFGRPDDARFRGRFPADFLVADPPRRLPAWHLVGGLDPLTDTDLTGAEPRDGHPVTLEQWIRQDGLTCLKVKLRGTDQDWDVDRLLRVGDIGIAHGVRHFCADFNCTVHDPGYVVDALDAVATARPELIARLLYVEQPFPYDLAAHPIDVHAISARTRLFLDESAHDWRCVEEGRRLGWNGVALKTCKTQSGALLSLVWAKAHGMDVMVQDLTNPMLAMIPHLRLAAHAGTLAGVETNGMQYYPEASALEAAVHPDAYRRRDGTVDLGTFTGPGFGMRVAEIGRPLPEPEVVVGTIAIEKLPGVGGRGRCITGAPT